SPVSYLAENEVRDVAERVIVNIRDYKDFLSGLVAELGAEKLSQTVLAMLLAGVTCLKHKGFEEEREWRAIYTPKISESKFMTKSTQKPGGVPQIVYELPFDKTVSPLIESLDLADVLDRIIIGPSPYPFAIARAFSDALDDAKIAPAGRIITSGI